MSSEPKAMDISVASDFWDHLPFDVRSETFRADPYPFYERLRADGPVARLSEGLLVVTGYRESMAVLSDPRFGFGSGSMESQSFLLVDPPEHRRLRAWVSAPFTVRAVERLRPTIGHKTHALIQQAAGKGEVDVVADLGVPLSLDLICALVGVPLDARPQWHGALSWLTAGFDPEALRDRKTSEHVAWARLEFARYLKGLIQERRQAPGDDLVSVLAAPGPERSTLTDSQIITAIGQLVVAGYEPTVDLMANGMYALLRHPQQLAYLREHPKEASAAVEEVMRYDPPFQVISRLALSDGDINGLDVAAGRVVWILTGAANRDPEVFADPHRLDVTRSPRHVSLGWGEHFCLGARLVRVQGQAMLTALAQCHPVLTGEPVSYRPTLMRRGVERLPVALTVQPDQEGSWS
ncbi:cytochrome P450 [Streptomyces gobiensis]|uniref:cytochrome P450 n=1 Tax=Streptomyces gobiensis TaxID=2875706 RepID=UPI001E31A059|nr:cytochrome P450 [Streptomyces gobiensis]UGY91170.1 cytochrome P450 [Streptomyces gobiensis]